MTPKPARILLVDDSAMQRAILQQFLEHAGFEVLVADGGVAGIAAAFEHQPDAVVSDVMMPEVGGYHLCRFIKNDALLRHTPVVLLTSAALQKADRFWGLKSGADAYLTKGEDPAGLLEILRRLTTEHASHKPTDSQAMAAGRTQIAAGLHGLFDKLLFETTVANDIRRLGGMVAQRDALLAEFAALVDTLFDVAVFAIAIFQPEEPILHLTLRETIGPATLRAIRRGIAQAVGPAALPPTWSDAQVVCHPPERFDDAHLKLIATAPLMCPLVVAEQTVGVVCLLPAQTAGPPVVDFHAVAREFAGVVGTLVYYTSAHRLAVTDGLTGLHNARFLLQEIASELARRGRYGRPCSLIIMDLDGFKQINDVFGHLAGDAVLKCIARILRTSKRTSDIASRYGGDEFMLLLPETELAGALVTAERLRLTVEAARCDYADHALGVTASIGVVEMGDGMTTSDQLIAAADQALYASKAAGRNAVHAWHEDGSIVRAPSNADAAGRSA